MTRVLALPRYASKGASSRLRTLQYVDELARHGVACRVESLLDETYLDDLYAGRRTQWARVARAYWQRLSLRRAVASFDVVWLEKEALPWLPSAAERFMLGSNTPIVVDYDDAIFHRYDQHASSWVRLAMGNKIDAVMRSAAVVMAGNDYLAERASQAGARRVEIIPTAIDLRRYALRARRVSNVAFTVGWIGTPQTAGYLREIAPALRRFRESVDVRYVFIGCPEGLDLGVPYEARAWSEATEAADLASFDCGVMPLQDGPFERGKCGYKLIQYMACGVPVVASPVGVNAQIVTPENGYLASSAEDWLAALHALHSDEAASRRMGVRGRALVEAKYSIQVVAPRLEAILRAP